MNQEKILEIIKRFGKEIDEVFIGETPKIEGEINVLYDCDIYIFRHPGMGNSKQVIVGSPLSIYTATASYLETLIRQGLLDENELRSLVEMSIKGAKGELRDLD